jgi:hypothetical protein
MSGRDEWELLGLKTAQWALKRLLGQSMVSWINLETGGYCVGRALGLTCEPRAVLVQHWHSGRVELLGPTAAETLRPYPSAPIPEART